MKKYEYILFDVDETLLDFSKASDNAFKELLKCLEINYTYKVKEAYESFNIALWHKFELGEMDVDTVLIQRWNDFFSFYNIDFNSQDAENIYQSYLKEGAFLLPGALNVLDTLKNNYKLSIITNGIATTQRRRLEKLDLFKYFEFVFISQEMHTRKPEGDFFDQVIEKIDDINLSKYLVVGDSLTSDIKGGINYGIDTCFVNMRGKDSFEEKPTYVINSITEILNILN